MTEDLKIIKKLYGEQMMHYCREVFSTILEGKGVLPRILQDNFAPSHVLYEDLKKNNLLVDFKFYIYNLFHNIAKKTELLEELTPKELIALAGYKLYECKTEEDIQGFKKYYAKGESLCTFRGGRLNSCYVFFAVKENVDEIKREDFKNPDRQDEYGTSVISIQFSKDDAHTLSIKNRYNHRVENPDATFGNNLDSIIEGLTKSFENTYGLKQEHINDGFAIPGYTRANDGKWYKYNLEINNVYYCSDNIIVNNGNVIRYDKEKYVIMDYFIIDLVEKKLKLYDQDIIDAFTDVIIQIRKIEIVKQGEEKKITIFNEKNEEFIIIISKHNQIISLKSKGIREVEDGFLRYNLTLAALELPNLQSVGDNFLLENKSLKSFDLPKLETIGDWFLAENQVINSINLPVVQKIGKWFLSSHQSLESLKMPMLRKVGDSFLYNNELLKSIELPNLEIAGDNFMNGNFSLRTLDLPTLKQVGHNFLHYNSSLADLNLPMLEQMGNSFLSHNVALTVLRLPMIKQIRDDFLFSNQMLMSIEAPLLKNVGNNFLFSNMNLISLNFPSLLNAGNNFLCKSIFLKEVNLPKLKEAGDGFLPNNQSLTSLILPELQQVGDEFLLCNRCLISIDVPKLRRVGYNIMFFNHSLRDEILNKAQESENNRK